LNLLQVAAFVEAALTLGDATAAHMVQVSQPLFSRSLHCNSQLDCSMLWLICTAPATPSTRRKKRSRVLFSTATASHSHLHSAPHTRLTAVATGNPLTAHLMEPAGMCFAASQRRLAALSTPASMRCSCL
jgi:hypothetical protein